MYKVLALRLGRKGINKIKGLIGEINDWFFFLFMATENSQGIFSIVLHQVFCIRYMQSVKLSGNSNFIIATVSAV